MHVFFVVRKSETSLFLLVKWLADCVTILFVVYLGDIWDLDVKTLGVGEKGESSYATEALPPCFSGNLAKLELEGLRFWMRLENGNPGLITNPPPTPESLQSICRDQSPPDKEIASPEDKYNYK